MSDHYASDRTNDGTNVRDNNTHLEEKPPCATCGGKGPHTGLGHAYTRLPPYPGGPLHNPGTETGPSFRDEPNPNTGPMGPRVFAEKVAKLIDTDESAHDWEDRLEIVAEALKDYRAKHSLGTFVHETAQHLPPVTDQRSKWRAMQKEIYDTAVSKGWYENPPNFGERIALMHSELSEALESYRKDEPALWSEHDKPEGWAIELADVVIRILDYCEHLNIDLEGMIRIKMAYNKTRPYKHGGKKI